MENLTVLAFLFVFGILAVVGAATYWLDTIADRHDRDDDQ
jgi:hypothetical protein